MSKRIHAYYKGDGWWGTVMRIFHKGDDIPETIYHQQEEWFDGKPEDHPEVEPDKIIAYPKDVLQGEGFYALVGYVCYRVDRPGAAGVIGVGYPWNTHESIALGCPPSQAAEMEQVAIRQGVPTEYDRKTGKAKLTSRKHLNDLCRAKGIVNFDGGFNDYTGSSQPVTESNFT